MKAEQRVDRAKSMTVARLEKQQLMGSQRPGETAQSKREESSPANGGTPVLDRNPELEEAHNKIKAVTEKQKEQIQKLEAENASLLSQITENKVKVPCSPFVSLALCGLRSDFSPRNSPTTTTHIQICSNISGHNMTM